MSVHTSILGGVRLTGQDAKKFRDQVTRGRPSKAAGKGLEEGTRLVKEYNANGFARISIKRK
jgi:hypothetical protein